MNWQHCHIFALCCKTFLQASIHWSIAFSTKSSKKFSWNGWFLSVFMNALLTIDNVMKQKNLLCGTRNNNSDGSSLGISSPGGHGLWNVKCLLQMSIQITFIKLLYWLCDYLLIRILLFSEFESSVKYSIWKK